MGKRPRKPIDLPGTSAEARTLLNQLQEHRKDVIARNREREEERDQARKIRIAARLVHFVRRGDSAAKKLLDQIFNGLRDGDRPLFVGLDLYPTPTPPVPISARHLPRTLKEIDDEIKRLEEHLEKLLAGEKEDDKRQHRRRMTIVGGALLGLVEAGVAEAGAMLDAILQKIPKKERKPFDGWDPPRLPAQAARAALPVPPSQPPGAQRSSSSASPRDTDGKDKKAPAASPAGQPSPPPVAGKDDTAAAKRGGEGSTPTATSDKNDGATSPPPGAANAEGEPNEPTVPFALDLRQELDG